MEPDAGDYERVRAAIREAESKTSAEIFAVLAEQSDDYRFAGYFVALFWILAGGFAVALWAWWGWIDIPLHYFAGFELAIALSAMLIVRLIPQLGARLVSKRVRHQRAHGNAARQFLAHGIHETSGRTGVLVFISLAERYAEIIADSVIAERCGQAFWDDIVAMLVEHARRGDVAAGFVAAIGMIGKRLAAEFPPDGDNPNELKDHLVLL